MSRIGKQKIELGEGITVTIDNGHVTVVGPKGSLSHILPPSVSIISADHIVQVSRADESEAARAGHGLVRTLIANMVKGVGEGFTKQLEIQGVGYRAALDGANLNLSLGFSHPVKVAAPEGITFKVEKNIISISGIDKAAVGEIAAKIRSFRKPEPYKGKGIRYVGEIVRRKAGKAAKA